VQGHASLTGAGLVLGTAPYLSPEQACRQAVTPASDLYSAGMLSFQMLTGNVPFTADSPVAVALSHVRDDVPSVRDFAPEVPPPLAEVVATATAKDPQSRYADAAQMGAALRKALAAPHAAASAPNQPAVPDLPDLAAVPDLPDLPAAAGAPGLLRRPAVATRALLIAVAGSFLVGAVAVGWLAFSGGPSPDEAETGPALAQPRQPQVTVTVQPPPAPTSSPTSLRQTSSETLIPQTDQLTDPLFPAHGRPRACHASQRHR
jgi:eukaryotic-like serine/threonine-protein kinase